MKVKLHKFMGFYNKGSYIEGQFGNLKIRGYFKENWAGLYIIGKKETFQFLFFPLSLHLSVYSCHLHSAVTDCQ